MINQNINATEEKTTTNTTSTTNHSPLPPSINHPNVPPRTKSRTKPINNLPRPQHRRHLLAPAPLLNHLRLAFTPQQPRRVISDPSHQRRVRTAAAASLADQTLLCHGVVGFGEGGGGFGGGRAWDGEWPGGGGGAGIVGGVD